MKRQNIQEQNLSKGGMWIVKINKFFFYLKRDIYLYLIFIIPLAYYITFKYLPMYGTIIAFKDYNIFKGLMGSEWIGLEAFREIFAMKDFYTVVRNTLLLNLLDFIFGFPMPILLAIALSELNQKWFKSTIQTIGYLPYFLSWIVIGGMLNQIFAAKGVVNTFVTMFGGETIPFLTNKNYWIITYILSGVWHGMGWNAIIYIAAITGINTELYEAATVDGCGRIRKIWYITLPGIRPTIVTMMILNLGRIVDIGFERPYAIGNVIVSEYSEVISTFVYNVGILSGKFSVATAVGLFQSVIGVVMIITANNIAKKLGSEGIW